MLMGQSGHRAGRDPRSRRSLAEAGLWKDAADVIAEAKQAAANVQPPFTQRHGGLGLRPHQAARRCRWPLGDGQRLPAAEQRLLRRLRRGGRSDAAVRPAQIFTCRRRWSSARSAEGWLPQLSSSITTSATRPWLKPDLRAAYFLRGWASYLADPSANWAQAKADVAKAAALAPPTRSIGTRPLSAGGRTEKRSCAEVTWQS